MVVGASPGHEVASCHNWHHHTFLSLQSYATIFGPLLFWKKENSRRAPPERLLPPLCPSTLLAKTKHRRRRFELHRCLPVVPKSSSPLQRNPKKSTHVNTAGTRDCFSSSDVPPSSLRGSKGREKDRKVDEGSGFGCVGHRSSLARSGEGGRRRYLALLLL